MWGVQFSALGLGGMGALPSSLHSYEDISRVLASHASAEMVARRDAAALERETGVSTEPRHLEDLVVHTTRRSRVAATLKEHGAAEVRARLLCGTSGPALEVLRAVPLPLDLGHVGPTPLAASARLASNEASTTIVAMVTMDLDHDAEPIDLRGQAAAALTTGDAGVAAAAQTSVPARAQETPCFSNYFCLGCRFDENCLYSSAVTFVAHVGRDRIRPLRV